MQKNPRLPKAIESCMVIDYVEMAESAIHRVIAVTDTDGMVYCRTSRG